jgi:hypothetical protein
MRAVAIPLISGLMRPYGKPTSGIPQEDIFGAGWFSFQDHGGCEISNLHSAIIDEHLESILLDNA